MKIQIHAFMPCCLKMNLKRYLFLLIVSNTVVVSLSSQFLNETVPTGLEAQIIEAQKYELIGNPDKSIEMFEKMRNIPETKSVVYYQLAKLYRSKSRLEDALNAINESILANPNNKWTRVYQANLYEAFGRYGQAANTYEALVKLEPENYTMYDLAALNYLKSDQPAKSLLMMEQAQNKFGLLPKIATQKYKLLNLLGKEKKSIDILLASHKEYPKHSDLLIDIIQHYLKVSQPEEAALYTKKLQNLKPNHPFLNQSNPNTATFQVSLEDVDKAAEPDPIIKNLLPELKNINSSNFDRLFQIAERLCSKFSSDPKTWALKADILYNADKLREASLAYQSAVGLANVPFTVWENYLVCLMKLSHWITLEEKSNQAIDFYPNQSFLFYSLALAQFNLKKYSEAKTQIDQFVLMNRNSPARLQEAHILIARISEESNKSDQAVEYWNKALQYDKNDIAVIEYSVSMAQKNKNFSSDKLQKAIANSELSQDYILSRMARILYHTKDYIKAEQTINSCLNLSAGQNSENFELAYLINTMKGDKNNARIMLVKALDLSDNKSYFQNLLNRLN